ncbi:DUF1853 family protein [Pelagicoccus albus]|uniref:DUF1853 family protein n=1 Tax=Pelagicoccus albus TaxID=415222 RepID=A0A7X1B6S6_9BACT|nr:DUF1853 family protein [Pelagicoccus albus]MBC2606734.1 DUF1853 family protein [Pelagicoccus albus]
MDSKEESFSKAILESIERQPVLLGELPEAKILELGTFDERGPVLLDFRQKLGHLYEDAFWALMQSSRRYEPMERNIQIFGPEGATLGELDFLLKDCESGRWVHVEFAVKFYLAWRGHDGCCRFIGPDPRDSWESKLERMKERQLRLGLSEVGASFLSETYGVDALEVRQRVYGIIFHHISDVNSEAPERVSSNYSKGRWLYRSQLTEFLPKPENVWVIPKCLWPCSITPGLLKHLEQYPAVKLRESAKDHAIMIWDDARSEKVFLLEDYWPQARLK